MGGNFGKFATIGFWQEKFGKFVSRANTGQMIWRILVDETPLTRQICQLSGYRVDVALQLLSKALFIYF